MNNIEKRLETIADMVQELLGGNYKCYHIIMPTVNRKKYGIAILEKGREAGTAPCLDVVPYIASGMEDKEIAQIVVKQYRNLNPIDLNHKISISDPGELRSNILEDVFPIVVGKDRNAKLLDTCPYYPILDLAVLFRVAVKVTEGSASYLVSNEIMEVAGLDKQDLLKAAVSRQEYTLMSIDAIMRENDPNFEEIPLLSDIYVLRSDQEYYGASAIMIREALDEAARKCRGSIYILPASTEELIICPAAFSKIGINPESIRDMVMSANRNDLRPEEVLSDRVYFYTLKDRKIRFAI